MVVACGRGAPSPLSAIFMERYDEKPSHPKCGHIRPCTDNQSLLPSLPSYPELTHTVHRPSIVASFVPALAHSKYLLLSIHPPIAFNAILSFISPLFHTHDQPTSYIQHDHKTFIISSNNNNSYSSPFTSHRSSSETPFTISSTTRSFTPHSIPREINQRQGSRCQAF